jgi:hypothetical protein
MDYVDSFVAGAFLCNSIPHFASGLRGEIFPTPLAKPRRKGPSFPLVNFLWGAFNVLVGLVLLSRHPVAVDLNPGFVVLTAGALAIGIYLSLHFGKVRPDSSRVISPSLREAKNALVVEHLPRHGGQPQISLVATDVPFEPPTLSDFRQFCRDLLTAWGWLVETSRTKSLLPGIMASRDGVTVFFVALLVPEHANLAARDALTGGLGASARCIVTNFTPSWRARQAVEAAGCSIVHYSRLNEWFELELLGRPAIRGRRW